MARKKPEEVGRLQSCMAFLRQALGLSQEQFAEKIFVSRGLLADYERQASPLSLNNYNVIRKYLDEEMRADPEGTVIIRDILRMIVDEPVPEKVRKRVMNGALRICGGIFFNRHRPKEEYMPAALETWDHMTDPFVGYFFIDD